MSTTARVATAAVLAVVLLAPAAPAEPYRKALRDKDVFGTWFAEIVLPPNPVLGTNDETVMLEYITFSKGGGIVATANFPLLRVPVRGALRVAIVSVSHSSWRRKGNRIQGTNYRFLNDAETGEFLGYMKNRVELRVVEPGVAQGRYLLDLLNPDLTLKEWAGLPATVGPGAVNAVRVPVERIE